MKATTVIYVLNAFTGLKKNNAFKTRKLKKIYYMCLLKTHDEPKIAQSDIEVWKVLTTKGLSPFQCYQYYQGMNKPAWQEEIPLTQEEISGGYLHAYRNKEKAKINLTRLGHMANIEPVDYVAQRMLIPKGTAYYEGDDDDICAECLYWPAE